MLIELLVQLTREVPLTRLGRKPIVCRSVTLLLREEDVGIDTLRFVGVVVVLKFCAATLDRGIRIIH